MQSPYPPRPPFAPRPGSSPEESDRNLVARAGGAQADAHAVALLLARHWRAAHEYAAICLATSADPASMAAGAAFHRVLGRATGGALRPQLLGAVRETVKEWAANDEMSALLPELRKPTGGRGLLAARSVTPERRRLAERAFQSLPGASQCLLWHTEVEAEPITVPAGLLGVDAGTASAALEQAREQFRTGCVRAHRELAPTRECRFYNRLLDVPIRRGGALLPDVQHHLRACRYCRHAAEQLSHFEDGLEVLLAETVLGWGARRYLDSRPGRETPGRKPAGRGGGRPGGRHRPGAAGRLGLHRRHTKAVLAGVGLTSLALLATVLVAKGWTQDGDTSGSGAGWGASSSHATRADPGKAAGAVGSPSAASAEDPVEVGRGRFRNLGKGLCLDIGGRVRTGAQAVLAPCSDAGSQRWSYQDDGLLRSVAEPVLCLDADAGDGTVVLADCRAYAGQVRYDLTVRGELLLRAGKGRLLAPGKGGRVVVGARDGAAAQRWLLEPERAGAGAGGRMPAPPDEGSGVVPAPRGPEPGGELPKDVPVDPSGQYERRFAQVGSEHTGQRAGVNAVHALPAVTSVTAAATTGGVTTAATGAARSVTGVTRSVTGAAASALRSALR